MEYSAMQSEVSTMCYPTHLWDFFPLGVELLTQNANSLQIYMSKNSALSQQIFIEIEKAHFKIHMEFARDPEQPKQFEKRRAN